MVLPYFAKKKHQILLYLNFPYMHFQFKILIFQVNLDQLVSKEGLDKLEGLVCLERGEQTEIRVPWDSQGNRGVLEKWVYRESKGPQENKVSKVPKDLRDPEDLQDF